MKNTETLLLSLLFIILMGLPRISPGQIYTPDPVHYQGRFEGEPVEVLVEYIQDVPLVLLYWPQREAVFRLRQQGPSTLFAEYTLFDNRPTRGQWRLNIAPGQVQLSEMAGASARLPAQPGGTTPEQVAAIRRAAPSSAVAFFQLCRKFTGIRYDLLAYGESVVANARRFSADDITFLQRPVNLTGSNAPELVVEMRIASFIHVVRVFQNTGPSWQALPSALFFKRNTRDAEPCLTEPPGPAYFYFDFAEVLRAGESILYGYTYDGHCANIYRGDDIFFYVWQVTPSGFREKFRAPVRQYWYKSPDPAPLALPVYQEFEFVAAAGSASFPRRLLRREGVFRWPEDKQAGTLMEPIDFRTEYLTIF